MSGDKYLEGILLRHCCFISCLSLSQNLLTLSGVSRVLHTNAWRDQNPISCVHFFPIKESVRMPVWTNNAFLEQAIRGNKIFHLHCTTSLFVLTLKLIDQRRSAFKTNIKTSETCTGITFLIILKLHILGWYWYWGISRRLDGLDWWKSRDVGENKFYSTRQDIALFNLYSYFRQPTFALVWTWTPWCVECFFFQNLTFCVVLCVS